MVADTPLSDLLLEFEAALARGERPDPAAFCRAAGCSHREDEFRQLVAFLDYAELFSDDSAPLHRDEPPPDFVAGRFQTDGCIGRGGLGFVYKATDAELGRVVALKTLQPQAAADPVLAERFRVEAAVTG